MVLFFLFLGGMGMFFRDRKQEQPKVNYVGLIASYETFADSTSFLKWVSERYGISVLEKIYDHLKNNMYDVSLWHKYTGLSYFVLQDYYWNRYETQDNVTVRKEKKDTVQIGYAGDVSLADNWDIMPFYKSRNKGMLGILSKGMLDRIQQMDWMIVNNEFVLSDRGVPMAGKLYTFRGASQNVQFYREMGVDMVTLANNHIYDFGEEAFLDTLSTLKKAAIPYIGAGKNSDEAKKPYYLIVNGYKIAFLNATRAEKYVLTPEASENKGGVFRCYDPTSFATQIQEIKKTSDYVVALVHWGTENTHQLEEVQQETGHLYIDSGADMVIGSHAHVLQGVEFYKGKLIAYNLGNFIFNDQNVDTGVLTWNLNDDGSSTFFFAPGRQKDCYTSLLEGKEASSLYQKLTEWSIHAQIIETGEIIEQ